MMNMVRSTSKCLIAIALLAATATLMVATPSMAQAQNGTPTGTFDVKGRVLDAHSKQPIAAAQIQALNNTASATTDQQGLFTIKVSALDEVLLVSAFDYAQREVAVRGKNVLDIELYPETFSSTNFVQELPLGKRRNTITVPSIKTVQDFTLSQAITADEFVQSELGGHVRSINRSGVAGMGTALFIRGYNSLLANAQPLYVIDGVPIDNLYDAASIYQGHYQNPLQNIDVNDIASITVMKDGTSIYGSKGSNGVILIKTIRGKDLVTKINLHITAGSIAQPTTPPMMDADQYRIFLSDIIRTAGYTNKQVDAMPFLNEDRSYTKYNMYHNQTNWNRETYQQGLTQSYMINVNGGDEKALYYFSVGYTKNDGVVKSTDFARINTRFNADIHLTKAIDLGVNIGYTNVEKTVLDDGVNFYTSPTYLGFIKAPFLSPHSFTDFGIETATNADADEFGIGNPATLIERSLNYTRQHNFDLGLIPTFKLTNDLTLSTQFNYNLNKYEENFYSPMVGVALRYLEGYGYSENMLKNQVSRQQTIMSDTKLSYESHFDGSHQLQGQLGWRLLNRTFESDYIEAHNSGSDNNTLIRGDFSYLQKGGINHHTNSISTYAGLDYSFRNRYLLSAALAVDGSSRFGTETRDGLHLFNNSWGVFPSINGAWLISSEPFMKSMTAIDLLKLRAGYGLTGNDGIEDYARKTYFAAVQYINRANGIVLRNIANETLQWETTGRANLGLDLGVFNDRLNLSFDVYSAKTSNLLIWKNLGELTGLDAYQTNAGDLTNKGFEAEANLKIIHTKPVQWEVGMTVGHYKNRITALPEGDIYTQAYGGTILSRVGLPAGVFYGYTTKGVFSTQEEAETANLRKLNNNGSYSYFGAGDIHFEDNVPDGIIDEKDRVVIGDPNPDFYGSISTKLTVQKFTLSALFNYSYGNDVYNYLRSQLESGSTFSNQTKAMVTRWRAEGQQTFQPRAVYGDPMDNGRFSDRWIEDGSYLRLKTVSLSYRIPIQSQFVSGMDVWVAANNLMTFTKYLGMDPEFSAGNAVLYQGIDAGLVPLTRSFFVGVKINL